MTRLAKPARPGRPGGPYPTAQAALLRRLDSHARAFFGEEEGDEEEVEEEKEEAVPASRPPHVGPAGGATEPSSSGDDSGDESNSCSSSDEEEGAGRARRGGARAPPVPQPRRPALVVVAGPGGRAAAPTTTAPHAPPPPLDLRAERKALMSGAADVTSGRPVPAWRKQADGRKKKKQRKPAAVAEAPTTAPGPSAVPTKAEFAAMRREVEEFGVANLDKRARAAAETRHLTSLGFPAPKRPRIPASIGLGMAAKQKELAAAALEAAIDAGLISRSGLGKKKKRAAEAARRAAGAADGGLDSVGGALRNGVLFVKEAPIKKRKGGGKRFNIDKLKL